MNNTTKKAREARNAYQRKWNKKNPDKVREYQRRYWERKAAELEAEERSAEKPEEA